MEDERRRVARDLHDGLGASLTRILLFGERLKRNLAAGGEDWALVEKIVAFAHDAARSLDEIIWAVNPENDTVDGLIACLSRQAGRFFENTGVRCRLKMPESMPASTAALPLSAAVRRDLLLVCREALTNILKHARATVVRVRVSQTASAVRILIEDNGCGFNPQKTGAGRKGHGLENMRKRLERWGGRLDVASRRGRGTRLTIACPFQERV